jgi:hypothetical protein
MLLFVCFYNRENKKYVNLKQKVHFSGVFFKKSSGNLFRVTALF